MTLAQTLQSSIQAKQEEKNKVDTKQKTEEKILGMIRDTQLKIWRLMIEQKINDGEAQIRLSLRKHNNKHVYLSSYEYQTNLRSLLILTKEGEKFVKWLKDNGLGYIIVDEDDGMGIESWQTLVIKPGI